MSMVFALIAGNGRASAALEIEESCKGIQIGIFGDFKPQV